MHEKKALGGSGVKARLVREGVAQVRRRGSGAKAAGTKRQELTVYQIDRLSGSSPVQVGTRDRASGLRIFPIDIS